ncbi:MAG: hypothetical protein KJT03_00380 [Verrucomicrobiae bacterium]|nr:hypothetical protein [Verrucomicrobiae bacterium]
MYSSRWWITLASLCLSAGITLQGQTLSLDGIWEIVFDPGNIGRDSQWHTQAVINELAGKRDIQVPGAWELIEKDYEGVAFYQRRFDVPADWSGKVVRLQFGAVNYLTEVWLNGEAVGVNEGGFTPFEFRVDEILKPGEGNVLNLRVVGPIILSQQSIEGVGPLETPQWRGGLSAGIWQPVKLVATGEVYVKDVFIETDIGDKEATFHVELDHTGIRGKQVGVEVEIREPGETSRSIASIQKNWELHPGFNEDSWTVSIPRPKLWSPDQPDLYQATIRVLADGKESDQWSARFGMRELTIKNKDFYLNGERIHIKATFFEGLYPNGIAYPDSEAMARREIRLAKEAGFNMIRPWRRPPAPMWLDLADEMGVLVVGSPALECMGLPLSTPYLPDRVENEIRRAVLRDRNRASVVQWELFNELHRPVLEQMMRPMAMLVRDLDPTRLILDESGGWAYGANMYLPYEYEPTKFNDIHNYPGPFINEERYDGFLTIGMTDEDKKAFGFKGNTPGRNVVPGLMSFVSELGYGSLPDLVDNNARFQKGGNPLTPAYRYHKRLAYDQHRILEESGFGYLYPDLQQFCLDQQTIHGAANKRMIEAVRSNPEVDGYCIHALAAGDWILGAGLIDLWRYPKSYAYEATKAANQPRILSIRVKPRNVYSSKGARLEINGINEMDAIQAEVSVEVVSADGTLVYSDINETNWKPGVSPLMNEPLDTQGLRGSYTVSARISSSGGQLLAENTYGFDVFSDTDLEIPPNQIALLDTENSLAPFLQRMGIDTKSFGDSTPLNVPVFVTNIRSRKKADQERLAALVEFVKKGGTAVYLSGVGKNFGRAGDNHIRSDVFPFEGDVHAAQGLWTCIPHLVKQHPIFEGLPSNTMMRDVYENVWATQTLRAIGGEALVASIGFDWFSREHKLHYSGPGESWWGSDLTVVPLGKGKALISQLRIIENLGKDPVADRLLFNIIRFLNS